MDWKLIVGDEGQAEWASVAPATATRWLIYGGRYLFKLRRWAIASAGFRRRLYVGWR